MTTVSIPLTDERLAELRARAARTGQSVEDFLSRRVGELLDRPDDEFRRAADSVLAKNAELYRRLA